MAETWSGKSVLIVDDSAIVRDNLANLFGQLGMQIAGTATDGVEALAKAAAVNPDFISLDIIMPEMDGIECYRALVKRGTTAKIFFASSLAVEPRVTQSFSPEIPPEVFLAKPLTRESVTACLRYFESIQAPPLAAIPAAGLES